MEKRPHPECPDWHPRFKQFGVDEPSRRPPICRFRNSLGLWVDITRLKDSAREDCAALAEAIWRDEANEVGFSISADADSGVAPRLTEEYDIADQWAEWRLPTEEELLCRQPKRRLCQQIRRPQKPFLEAPWHFSPAMEAFLIDESSKGKSSGNIKES